MNQSVIEVIVYLLEVTASQVVSVDDAFTSHLTIKQKLVEAGFTKEIISSAFDWLRELVEQQNWYEASINVDASAAHGKTLRIFSPEESARIGLEVRNFILSLEYSGILDMRLREIIISQLMQLNQRWVDLMDAKWVVLLVLMSKSNRSIQELRSYLLTTTALAV